VTLKDRLLEIYAWLGRAGIAFVVACLGSLLPLGLWKIPLQFAAILLGLWLLIRLARWCARQAIWGLRNRLLVTYTFIAVVPLTLIILMAGLSASAIMNQLAIYLATAELDRRVDLLTSTAETLRIMDPARRESAVERMFDLYYKNRFQGIMVVVREGDSVFTYPKDLTVKPPPVGWKDVSGIVNAEGQLLAWAHRVTASGDITVTTALTQEYLAGLLPKLGLFDLRALDEFIAATAFQVSPRNNPFRRAAAVPHRLPPQANPFDIEIGWIGSVPTYLWDKPSETPEGKAVLEVKSRPSMIVDVIFAASSPDLIQNALPGLLLGFGILFLIVELIALMIGVSMTRTMTSAVHELYEGTRRVQDGDFSRRIPVKGNDQLAELGQSFNRMTENVQHLLTVAKEKERLQSEIEIAREVQGQLYPKQMPPCKSLRLKAFNQPARMVSGDYFDYDGLANNHLSFALGDVAGKGISAALLMAALQSSVRAQWSHSMQRPVGEAAGCPPISTSKLVCELNLQLYKNTAPEKYATFFLGLYDPVEAMLTYTNAGHLPPLLFRKGEVTRLEIDGTVVGAFPFADYGESKLKLESGDLLLCYTDGISEPENAYGEMYGEERLIEVVQRNIHKTDDQLVEAIMESVLQWTGSPELQDDMTMLLAWQQ
jgi:phosphoserine phosphatase RsbU/P